jgi:hypothetical protein
MFLVNRFCTPLLDGGSLYSKIDEPKPCVNKNKAESEQVPRLHSTSDEIVEKQRIEFCFFMGSFLDLQR